jgi:RNA polymerase sigma-70 factor (ECF subfamily)
MQVAQRATAMRAGYPVPPAAPVSVLGRDDRPDLEEQDLLQRVHQGDELAFARLFEQHWDAVARLMTRVVGDPEQAGDVAQEVFVQLFRKPPALGEAPLRAWLFRVALNRGYNALRADRRRRTREDVVARDPSASLAGDAGVLEEANRAEERDVVRRTLLRLPARQRECLVLRAEGLTYAEVAGALGVAPGSVGTLLARAERAFKEIYRAQRGGM